MEQARVRLEALRSLAADGEVVPYDVNEDAGELLPWAVTDNGDVCFWRCSPRHEPDRWRVVVNEACGPGWEAFDLTARGFLLAVLSGRARVRAFPSDVPSAQPGSLLVLREGPAETDPRATDPAARTSRSGGVDGESGPIMVAGR